MTGPRCNWCGARTTRQSTYATRSRRAALSKIRPRGRQPPALGGYLRALGLIAPPVILTIHQGRDMGRPRTLLVDVPASDNTGSRSAGRCAPRLTTALLLPHTPDGRCSGSCGEASSKGCPPSSNRRSRPQRIQQFAHAIAPMTGALALTTCLHTDSMPPVSQLTWGRPNRIPSATELPRAGAGSPQHQLAHWLDVTSIAASHQDNTLPRNPRTYPLTTSRWLSSRK